MKLTKVTFTGIDGRTDLSRLESICRQHPYVEFGVLMSKDWHYNGNRFPNPVLIKELEGRDIPLSLHLCGEMAVNAVMGDFSPAINMCGGCFNVFSRVQLNIQATGLFQQIRSLRLPGNIQEIIVQMHTPDMLEEFFKEFIPKNVSYLIDASGGRGIDTPIDIVTYSGVHVGYAGGISASNVEGKLRKLLEYDSDDSFWIDMETRVRDDCDWFSLDRVECVLDICDRVIGEYK